MVVLAAGVAQVVTQEPAPLEPGPAPIAVGHAAALRTFEACDDALAHIRAEAADRVGPWGLEGQYWALADGQAVAAEGDATSGAGLDDAAAPAARVAGADYSTTNVQEVGVDEPDLVKTDGSYLYTVVQGRLRVLDVRGADPAVVHDEPLGNSWDHQLLLDGDRLLVLSSRSGVFAGREAPVDQPMSDVAFTPVHDLGTATATLYDVSDPAAPHEIERLDVEGWRVAARMIDGVARLVVRADPAGMPWAFPMEGGPEQERAALAANRELVMRSTLSDWLPAAVHTDRTGATPLVSREPIVPCDRIHTPVEFSGFGSLSVLTLDLAGGWDDAEAATVLAGGDTVYASATSLYVATNRWIEQAADGQMGDGADDAIWRPWVPGATQTDLHVFDIADASGATYLGSGSVPGQLLNQFSMSEHDGYLRVATTVEATPERPSQSAVRVLELRGDRLAEVGSVGGLGLDERIYAVRYLGDVAYVVTFRETDPLYTVDLSDPTAPHVRGELKILGYSAYLHPVGDGLLLGIGQDATEQGQTLGTQVSLFDVSDLDAPRRVANTTVQQGYSDAEYDHHAFLWWAPTGMAMLPVSIWSDTGSWSGAIGLRVDTGARTLDRVGQVSHDSILNGAVAQSDPAADPAALEEARVALAEGWVPPIVRSVVIDGSVYTFSEIGLVVADLDTLEVESSLAW
ncbi:MAG: beta-propeller domain-containing protein [Actinobacteria bacterium]|nr:beta-propeller domain-containing protein [Actinomycetota bacterium]